MQRLVKSQYLRRIDRGLYDKPYINALTAQTNPPDYQKVIEAISRRDQVRLLIDGMTCANDLGLTNAAPGQVLIHTDGRLKPIKLGKLTIKFKLTAPSKLFWAGRPGMRIVQSMYWLHDTLSQNPEQNTIKAKLTQLLQKSTQKDNICQDLQTGMHTLPAWMQTWLRELLMSINH